jgi:hypothetical protein
MEAVPMKGCNYGHISVIESVRILFHRKIIEKLWREKNPYSVCESLDNPGFQPPQLFHE